MENLLSQVENTVQAFSTEQKTIVNEQLKHHCILKQLVMIIIIIYMYNIFLDCYQINVLNI